ncbi:MAG: hypothetical protein A07HR60_00799 [uncultured archaeon A07HR60]|nr:MAG: hypothetical protein J07HR59_01137 [Halorubrum sp. J07HR59]ESS12256.1 MAG: hypothetical protein A07HR60_00799 [uncultured archaeon A07HR60]
MRMLVEGVIETVIGLFGPFVIPVGVFAAGLVGYLILVYLGRAGLTP